jgi:hypothetical protein
MDFFKLTSVVNKQTVGQPGIIQQITDRFKNAITRSTSTPQQATTGGKRKSTKSGKKSRKSKLRKTHRKAKK